MGTEADYLIDTFLDNFESYYDESDEDDAYRITADNKTCERCGAKGLHWKQVFEGADSNGNLNNEGKWRLHYKGALHVCESQESFEDLTNE